MPSEPQETLAEYLERQGLCDIFDTVLKSSAAPDPCVQVLNKLEELHLSKLGFLNRRNVEGSRIAVNKRCILCTDLTYSGDSTLEYRVELLVKCIKTLTTMNASVLLCTYDDSSPWVEDDEVVLKSQGSMRMISPRDQNLMSKSSPSLDPTPHAHGLSNQDSLAFCTSGTSAITAGDDDDAATLATHPHSRGLDLLKDRLVGERLQLKVLANGPVDLLKLDLNNLQHSTVLCLPNLSGHVNDKADAPASFLNPMITYGDLYVCDALSHMARNTLCTTALPRAISEVVLGINASQELRGLGPILTGASCQTGNRVLLIGDDDTTVLEGSDEDARTSSPLSSRPTSGGPTHSDKQSTSVFTATSTKEGNHTVRPASSASACSKKTVATTANRPDTVWTPMMTLLEPAFDNMVNLFDVILVAGTAAATVRKLQQVASNATGDDSNKPDMNDELTQCVKNLLDRASASNVKVVAASDWTIAKRTASGKVRGDFLSVDEPLPPRFFYADMGPETLESFGAELSAAESVFMIGRLSDPGREHLGAVRKIASSSKNTGAPPLPSAPSTEEPMDAEPFVLSAEKLLSALPTKAHSVASGETWINNLAYLKEKANPIPKGGHRLSTISVPTPYSLLAQSGPPEPLNHVSLLPYTSIAHLLKGDVFQSFAELPQPTTKKQ